MESPDLIPSLAVVQERLARNADERAVLRTQLRLAIKAEARATERDSKKPKSPDPAS